MTPTSILRTFTFHAEPGPRVYMKFCSACGQPVTVRVPPGDHLPRFVCPTCGTIHYENPRVIAGCIPALGDRIVLCRRAIEPQRGFWTVPAGFLENGESVEAGAAREAMEEALARVEIGGLVAVVSVLHARQVHMFFRARLLLPEIGIGPESLEVRLCTKEEIPWPDIAFRSVRFALETWLADRRQGREDVHYATLDRAHPSLPPLPPVAEPPVAE